MIAVNCSGDQHIGNVNRSNRRKPRLALVALASAPVAWGLASTAHGQLVWDASGTATSTSTATDGPGFWDVTNTLGNPDSNWFNGVVDGTWIPNDTATFGNFANNPSSGAAGMVTIDDNSGSVAVSAINFDATASGNYTIAAIAGDSLDLTGGSATLPTTVTAASGESPTISAPISGSNGLTLIGPGTLNLSGANTYGGNTVLNSGVLNLNAGGTLGSGAGLVMGLINAAPGGAVTPPTSVSTLNVNTSATISAFTVNTNSASNNTITVGSGQTLTVSGAVTISLNPKSGTTTTVTGVVISGGTLSASNGTFEVGTGETDSSQPATAAETHAMLDMSGLSNFVYSGGSNEFDVGNGAHGQGTVNLANVSNSITAATVRVGDSTDGTVSGNAGAASTLSLGAGTNVIDANQINVGEVKDTGALNFLTTTGSLVINNEAGSGGANMNVGDGASGSSSAVGTVNLDGHNVDLNFGTLNIGNRANSVTVNVGATGSFSFDDGTVTAATFVLAHEQGTTATAGFALGSMTVGSPGDVNSATLVLSSGGNLANCSSGANCTATGVLTIDQGGYVESGNNLTTSVNDAGNSVSATILVAGGTLNMMGHNISGSTDAITSISYNTTLTTTGGELENVGTINGSGTGTAQSVTMATAGNTLILDGTNSWTGGTTVSAGTIQVGQASDTAALTQPLGAVAGTVTDNSALVFASSQATTVANPITGTGTVAQSGSGTTTLSSASNNYSGQTTVSAGTLFAGAANALSPNSAVDVTGGTLDVSGFANTVPSLTIGAGGTLNLAIGNVLADTGTASFGGTLNVSGTPSGSMVELMSYTSETGTFASVPTFAGYTLAYTPTELELISSGPASLSWNNLGASAPDDGKTWDTTSNNWNNGSSATTYADGDAVTFNDTNNGNYSVTLNTTVSPASVTVNNSSGNYSITGAGKIADAGAFTKSGTGSLTLGTALSAGSVSITGGTMVLATNTTLGSGSPTSNINISSMSITGTGQLDITNNHIIIDYGSSDPMSTIYSYLKSGYNNGAWNGVGIISSSARTLTNGLKYGIGFSDGNDRIAGHSIVTGLSSGQIELKYTLLGDANLDGTVNGSDFSILAANFGQGYSNWDQGNFEYTPAVNGTDFSALAANFGQGDSGAAATVSQADIQALDAFAAANGLPAPTIAAVPEPATIGLIVLAGIGTLSRRRRKA